MVLLLLESTQLYENLLHISSGTAWNKVVTQFFHHPWDGLRFWDLIQPGFMFIAGTALAYSLKKQEQTGVVWRDSFIKVFTRCLMLFFWGVLNYAVESDGTLSFELWNVLTQLSVTTLIAFLIFHWHYKWQITFCGILLLVTELLYRFTNIPGFDEPFRNLHNFGNYMDLVLMNKINGDGWVAINVLPTAVHTIAGAMTGKVLMENAGKFRPIILIALSTLIVGYLLHLTEITPIIKRIATSSFTLVTTGWCLLAIALTYWWIDVKKHQRYLLFFTIVGMNSLFIYLFCEIVGARWFNGYAEIIVGNILGWVSTPESLKNILVSLFIFAAEWYMCYFLYKNKVFIKV